MSFELTDEQIRIFQDNGFLILPALFSREEVERMRYEADCILELIINSSIALERVSRRLELRRLESGGQIVQKIQTINDLSLYLSDISADERRVGPLRQLMNDEPMLIEEKLNFKQPLPEPIPALKAKKSDDRFPVHNDWAYFLHQNYPTDVISSAISMDQCCEDSGPLRIWPGSHRKHLEHEKISGLGLQVLPHLIDLDGGEDVLAPPGTVMLFHSLLVHNSRSNVSERPRRMMIYSHFPKRFDLGFDIRNGPARLRESPYEWAYQRIKNHGEFQDVFQAPEYHAT